MEKTFYPGVGADEAIAKLQRTVGEITSFWAQVEDGLFELFVVATLGAWLVGDIRPIRAVFFTFSSYEGKMRMVHNAMRTRYDEKKDILSEWAILKKNLDGAAGLRNEIAHLVPMTQSTLDKDAKANVRLIAPFWKSMLPRQSFDEAGYSLKQLEREMAPYWGYRPPYDEWPDGATMETLGYRLQQFSQKLIVPPNTPPTPQSSS